MGVEVLGGIYVVYYGGSGFSTRRDRVLVVDFSDSTDASDLAPKPREAAPSGRLGWHAGRDDLHLRLLQRGSPAELTELPTSFRCLFLTFSMLCGRNRWHLRLEQHLRPWRTRRTRRRRRRTRSGRRRSPSEGRVLRHIDGDGERIRGFDMF